MLIVSSFRVLLVLNILHLTFTQLAVRRFFPLYVID